MGVAATVAWVSNGAARSATRFLPPLRLRLSAPLMAPKHLVIRRRPSTLRHSPNQSGSRLCPLASPRRSPMLTAHHIRRQSAGLYLRYRRRGGLPRHHLRLVQLIGALPGPRPTAGRLLLCGEEPRPRAVRFLAMCRLQRRLETRLCACGAKLRHSATIPSWVIT